MFFARRNLLVDPRVALQQSDLLIHLLVEPGQHGCTRLGEGRGQDGFIPDLARQSFGQTALQSQGMRDLVPPFPVEFLLGRRGVLQDVEDTSVLGGVSAEDLVKSGCGRLLGRKRLIDQGLHTRHRLGRDGVFSLGQFGDGR